MKVAFVVILYSVILQSFDYALIFPSIWLFLQSLDPNIPEWWLGITIGAFGFSGIIVSQVCGFLLDKYRCMKQVFLVTLACSALGMAIYAFAVSPTMVIISRLVAGMGNAIFVARFSLFSLFSLSFDL